MILIFQQILNIMPLRRLAQQTMFVKLFKCKVKIEKESNGKRVK